MLIRNLSKEVKKHKSKLLLLINDCLKVKELIIAR